jgi:hypothetical protein
MAETVLNTGGTENTYTWPASVRLSAMARRSMLSLKYTKYIMKPTLFPVSSYTSLQNTVVKHFQARVMNLKERVGLFQLHNFINRPLSGDSEIG